LAAGRASIIAMSSPSSRRRLRWVLVAVAVVVAIVGAVAAVIVLRAPGNESHPNVEFTAPTTATPPAPAVSASPPCAYAAAPTALGIAQGLVFIPVLSTERGAQGSQAPGNGRLVAVSMKNGHQVWSHAVPAGTESSPLAWQNAVYFGDQSGTVYSLRARDG